MYWRNNHPGKVNDLHWQERDKQFLPDTSRWGRGYGGKPYTQAELEETRGYIFETLQQGGLAGYQNRGLIMQADGFVAHENAFVLPPGFDAEHPSRLEVPNPLLVEPNSPTSLECIWRVPAYLERYYAATGAPLDQHGRWVHPLARQVMEAGIPLCTGYGMAYEGGETIVIDIVVDDGDHVLFTRRDDNGRELPSLVGGYTWGTDYTTIENWRVGNRPITHVGICRAARRIVRSKTGIELPEDTTFEIKWGIRPWSSPHTVHFGTVTYTLYAQLESGASRHLLPAGGSRAYWQAKRSSASEVNALWPDHRRGYEAVMA